MNEDNQHKRTASAMFLLAWIILFFGLIFFFHYYGSTQSKVYISNASEYALSADQDGHYHIQGRINEYPVVFLVDTGATLVTIPQTLADKVHLNGSYPVIMSTANGQITGSLTRIQNLSFGDMQMHNVKAVIIPGGTDEVILLGMNVLSQFDMVQQGKKLILKKLK